MQPEALTVVDLFEEGRYDCTICKEMIKGRDLAAWVRLEPGSPFDPMCHWCLLTIFKAAEHDLTVADAVDRLFKL